MMKRNVISLSLLPIWLNACVVPFDCSKFQDLLLRSKLQAPTSRYDPHWGTKYGAFEGVSNRYFYLSDEKFLTFAVCGYKHRSELRRQNDWRLPVASLKKIEATVKVVPLKSEKELTFLQIHADANVSPDVPNKPLLRVAWRKRYHAKNDHIWAVIRVEPQGDKFVKIDLGKMPDGFFDIKVKVSGYNLTIDVNNIKKCDLSLKKWRGLPCYFKAGVYLQKEGCGKVMFEKLKILD